MKKSPALSRSSKILLGGLILTTLGIWRSGTDPVNIPKLVVIAVFSSLILGSVLTSQRIKNNRIVFSLVSFFVLTLLIPVFFSGAPLVQQLFGVSGRNTGLFTYIFLSIFFLGAASLVQENDFRFIPYAILLAGFGSGFFCILELLGINLLGANNSYGAILGTFGNPNFVSAFSGMISVGSFALAIQLNARLRFRVLYSTLSVLSLFLVIQSKSFQGLGATFFGIFLLLVMYFYFKRIWVILSTLLIVGSLGFILLVLGLLDRGPLAAYIFQYTLPIRLQYWQAGITMLKEHPFTGVGLNTYGDWYRSARDADALITPGPNVTTNVAHNVYIDFASNGGVLLGISSISLFASVLFYALRTIKSMQSYDSIFISTFLVWLLYSIQAFFSIDQIGLSVWGWTLGGALIGMSKLKCADHLVDAGKSKKPLNAVKSGEISKSETRALVPQFILFWIFVFVAVPPFKADLDWAEARRAGSVNQLAMELKQWPQDEIRYSRGVYLFLTNSLEDQALTSTLEGIEIFSRSTALWSYLYQNPLASPAQKNLARKNLIKLDPLNPEFSKLKKF
jgi:O-antigen ligase